MAKLNIDAIRSEALSIIDVWKSNPQFQLSDLTAPGMEAEFNEFDSLVRKENSQSNELDNLRLNLEAKGMLLREASIRARAGMQGFFGRNSNQYSLAGGTRMMDRKSRRRANGATTDSSVATDTAK